MPHDSSQEPTHISGEIFVAAAGSLLLHALAASCLFGFLSFICPLLGATYQELEVELTQIATQILSISRVYQQYWLPILLGVAIVDLVIVIALVRLPPARRWMLTGFNYLWLAITLVLVARGTALLVAPLKGWLAEL